MAGHRLPRTLFGGRMRTSTALLSLAFVGVLLLWLAVRPDPAVVTETVVRTTRTTVKETEEEERRRPAEEVRTPVVERTPTPTPSPTRTPKRPATPTGSPGAAGPTDAATPGLPLPTEPSPVPSESASPEERSRGGLLGLRGARAPDRPQSPTAIPDRVH